MLRRLAEALPHGCRSLATDDHGRSRGRAARGAREPPTARSSRLRSRASGARSSFRSRRRPPSRSEVSAPTSCIGRASWSRCPSGARRSTRSTSSRIAEGIATLDLRVSSGTYVRSIADALGGHCVSLRRTEVGPFSVEEADAERVLSSRRGARADRADRRRGGGRAAAEGAAPTGRRTRRGRRRRPRREAHGRGRCRRARPTARPPRRPGSRESGAVGG